MAGSPKISEQLAETKTKLAETVDRLTEAEHRIGSASSENVRLEEALNQAMSMLTLEDRGWLSLIGGGVNDDGFSLDDLKSWNEQIQNAMIGNPHVGNGFMLRYSYIHKDGIKYRFPQPKQGKPNPKVRAKIDTISNQRNAFGATAYRKREAALFSGSFYLLVGNDSTHELEPIPLGEITEFARHPKRKAEIIAYRHSYSEFNPSTGESKDVNEWIYVDHYTGPKSTTIKHGGKNEPVLKGHTAFDLHANGVDDYALGSPDALAALIWARIVRDLYMDGVTISHALASFAFKATAGSKKGSENAALKLAGSQTPGATALVGGVNDLVPMSSAGKVYQFSELRSVVANVAAALHISVVSLTSDPGAAGSSYGSAATLDLPTRLAMESRRLEHVEFDSRILRWMGAKDFEVYFEPYTDMVELLRGIQGDIALWTSGLYSAEEMKAKIEGKALEDVTVPDGVLLPNNSASLPRKDIDADGVKPSASGPGQGKSTGAGKTASGNDMRTDGVSEMLAAAERIGKILEEIEGDRAA